MKKYLGYIVISLVSFSIQAQDYKLFGASVNGKVQLKWLTKQISRETAFDVYKKEGSNWEKLNATPIVPSPLISDKELKSSKNPFPNDEAYEIYVEHYAKKEATANKQAYADYTLVLNSILKNELAKHRGIYFEDASVQNGKVYSYKLVDAKTQKELSILNNITVGTLGKAPENVKFQQNKQNIEFTWSSNEDYIGYNLYRNNEKLNDDFIMPNAEKGVISLVSYKDSNVPAGNYTYVLKGITFLNTESNATPEIKVEVKDLTPPPVVKGVNAERKNLNVTITWKPSLEKEVVGYNIHKSTDMGKTFAKITSQPIKDAKYVDILKKEVSGTIQYKVEALDSKGNGILSMPVAVYAPDAEAPSMPVEVKGTAEPGKISLSWKANSEKDLAGYRIYRGLKDDDENDMLLLNVTPQSNTSFVDTFYEKAGTKFIYKVTAIDKSFNESEKVSVWVQLPDVVPPQAPFLKEATFERESVRLKWDAVMTDAILGYDVYRVNNGTEKKVNTDLVRDLYFNDITLKEKGIYEYFVKAVDSAKLVSKPSNKIAITTASQDANKIQLVISQDPRAKKVQIKIEGISALAVQEAKLFRKVGDLGFLRIPFQISEAFFTDETSEEGVIYEYYAEIITTDEVKLKTTTVQINNTF